MSHHELSSPVHSVINAVPSSRRSAIPGWKRSLRRAERQAERGNLAEAILSVQQAMKAGAEEYDCYLQMAAFYRGLRQLGQALAATEKAIRVYPLRVAAYETAMSLALEINDCERVIALGQTLLKLAPRHIAAYDMISTAFMQKGDMDAALRATNALIRLDPHTAAHHFKKALLCQDCGEVALAVEEFMQAIVLEPEGPHADAAREALEILDTHQLNQILTLAMEDVVFRAKLSRDPTEAAAERGFYLSSIGNQMLSELSQCVLMDFPETCRPTYYN